MQCNDSIVNFPILIVFIAIVVVFSMWSVIRAIIWKRTIMIKRMIEKKSIMIKPEAGWRRGSLEA